MQPNCEEFDERGTVARYVAGTATSEEARAFEEHYVGCYECFNSLALAAGVRVTLREPAVSVVEFKPRSRRRFYGVLAGVGMAAVLGGILIMRSASLARIETLGAVGEAPGYGGVAVRANEQSAAEQQFDRGMAAYAGGRYQQTVTYLERALQNGLEPLPAVFFLGASHLMLNDANAAVARFEGVLAEGDSPYTAEAHYYLAKALLRLRRADEALAQLSRAAAATDPIAPRARALADSVQRTTSRFF